MYEASVDGLPLGNDTFIVKGLSFNSCRLDPCQVQKAAIETVHGSGVHKRIIESETGGIGLSSAGGAAAPQET